MQLRLGDLLFVADLQTFTMHAVRLCFDSQALWTHATLYKLLH